MREIFASKRLKSYALNTAMDEFDFQGRAVKTPFEVIASCSWEMWGSAHWNFF